MLQRVQVTDTYQLFRCESGLHCQIAAKKLLLKDTNKKKRHACTKKTQAMNIRSVEICPLVSERLLVGLLVPTAVFL